ncbi:MAG: ATP-binding cassette domain-containing protein [Lachnospiraceae bacterium]|nr:ATP-binding cassette domain-containing protein [Lachnospiraceae bacterium]
MIQAENLIKTFTRTEKKKKRIEFNAVDGISIDAYDGEILGILGPNGAGKTTLLRMLGKLMRPTGGTVAITDVEGRELTQDVEIKQNIGYLSGNTKLYKRFSAREMLSMLGEIYGMTKEETENRIIQIIDILDLGAFVDNRIERLSTGQTQRISIARCLLHSPQVYIFDEPTLGLDIISSRAIIDFMKREKANGKTVLYSTHYMEEAEFLCDRIVMIHQGHVIAKGSPLELKEQTSTTNLRETFLKLIENETDVNGGQV